MNGNLEAEFWVVSSSELPGISVTRQGDRWFGFHPPEVGEPTVLLKLGSSLILLFRGVHPPGYT